jgi:hypothetical protein
VVGRRVDLLRHRLQVRRWSPEQKNGFIAANWSFGLDTKHNRNPS